MRSARLLLALALAATLFVPAARAQQSGSCYTLSCNDDSDQTSALGLLGGQSGANANQVEPGLPSDLDGLNFGQQGLGINDLQDPLGGQSQTLGGESQPQGY